MKILSTCFLLALSCNAFSYDKVVYGTDDRKDIYESTNNLHKELARSTAAMISAGSIEEKEGDMIEITGATLEENGICPEARFSQQTVAANCSGFLVGDEYLVTAGHCIETMTDCARYSWVFDFANLKEDSKTHIVPKSAVYTCTQIVSRVLDRGTENDYALLKLDRKVEGRTPLKFRTSGKVATKADLVVIGHPTGLPSKIADGAYVRKNTNKYFFQANLDTFGGNSGSAVFDSKTGVVEGILVRGERDYVNVPGRGCEIPNVCKMNDCRGEDVTRITNIKELKTIIK